MLLTPDVELLSSFCFPQRPRIREQTTSHGAGAPDRPKVRRKDAGPQQEDAQ